jgi:hypothetical protein
MREREAVSRSRGRWIRAGTAALLSASTLSFGAEALADPPEDVNAPAEEEADTPAEKCSLRKAAHGSAQDEWASCLSASVAMQSLPAVGERAVLTLRATAQYSRDVQLRVELPANLEFVQAPRGFAVEASRATVGTGASTAAVGRASLAAGGSVETTAVVRAIAAGPAQVRLRVNAPRPNGRDTDGAADSAFFTVGTGAGSSTSSVASETEGGTEPTTGAVDLSASRPRGAANKVAALPAQPLVNDDPVVAAPEGVQVDGCATGSWHYVDEDSVLRASRNYQVQAWDDDTSSGDDLLATGVTNGAGGYTLCWSATDGEGDVGQEVYIRFVSENSTWRVRDTAASDSNYVNSTGAFDDIDLGETHNYGSLQPANDVHQGLHAFDAMDSLWLWTPGACFDRDDVACRQMVANWTNTSVDGTYYSLGGNDIHLAADDPDSEHTVIHEATHATMDDVYEDDFPPAPNCNPHFIQGLSSTGCAWTEGFAEWVPAEVLDDPYYRWPDGASLNLETPSWTTGGWDDGTSVEGRIAGALIDMSDTSTRNEAYWDIYGEGDTGTGDSEENFDTFIDTISDTFSEFILTDRIAQGHSLTDYARGSIFQNTIDFTFRDPMANYDSLQRPSLLSTPTTHRYHFDTSTAFWSAVGLRQPTANYSIDMFDDLAQTIELEDSTLGTGVLEYVVVDSNQRALGDYYPRATAVAGSAAGNYDIELAQGSLTLVDGSQTFANATVDVIRVLDSFVSTGVPTYFRVVPAAGQDVDLLAHDSDPAASTSWVQGRSQAVETSGGFGVGASEQFSITPATGDTYAIVVTQESGSGSYTIYRDTSAPTGSVSIDAGAAVTRDTSVTLTLAASDAQTGINAMRISTDGTMDTELYEPFAAAKVVTLPAGDGLKTVLAQFRNNAFMTSGVVSDTITLDTRPDMIVDSVTDPPAIGTRGDMFSLTDTTHNLGPTSTGVASKTVYYLSTDSVFDAADKKLGGNRSVPILGSGDTSTGAKTVKIGKKVKSGTYHVLACADGATDVDEFDETNNCVASVGTIEVQVPDLRVTSISDPPASAAAGTGFEIFDTTRNVGTLTAGASSTRYFLSLDSVFDAGDIALDGDRSIGSLAPGVSDTGSRTSTIPGATPGGVYHLLACADAAQVVSENNENNNCKVATTTITVT